jgi:hypothetical protein
MAAETSSERDFDFWMGSWEQRNRRRKEWLADCDEWIEFESTSVAWPILDGLGNADELRTDFAGGFVGMSFRFFDLATRLWSIYWADTRRTGLLDPPVVGSFASGVGVFEGGDTFKGSRSASATPGHGRTPSGRAGSRRSRLTGARRGRRTGSWTRHASARPRWPRQPGQIG